MWAVSRSTDPTGPVTVGADLVAYVGSLTLAGGDGHGEPFTVFPWERRFLRGTSAGPRMLR